MPSGYYEHMTKKQKDLIDKEDELIPFLIKNLLSAAIAYKNSIVKLPHVNEEGFSVLNGCNNRVLNGQKYCMDSILLILRLLPDTVQRDYMALFRELKVL